MNCPLCHSTKNTSLFIAQNIHGRHQYGKQKTHFFRCDNCNCVFPKVSVTPSFYKKYYPKKYNSPSPFLEELWSSFSLLTKKQYLPKHGSLLDVGCGQAKFIKSLPTSIKATGIDLNPAQNNNLNIIKADFLKHKFLEKYNTITFWHSLEHFSNPQKTIDKAIKLLSPQGQIIISLPNTNSLAFKLGQNNWFHLDSPRHLFLPNNINIKKLLPKNSQINIYFQPFEFPLDLFWSLKKYSHLRLFYPLLKLFDKETMLVIFKKKHEK